MANRYPQTHGRTRPVSIAERPTQPADASDAPSPPSGKSRAWVSRGHIAAAAAALAVAVAGVVALASAHGGEPLSTAGRKGIIQTAISLPYRLQGLDRLPSASDPTHIATWQQKAKTASKGAVLAAQGYGTPGSSRTLRVVAARTDLTGTLELGWAADSGHSVGSTHCTQNVRFVPGGQAGIRPTIMLCWRTSESLSVYALMIDPRATLTDADAAPAVDLTWDAVSK
jgi:hypothetical protein